MRRRLTTRIQANVLLKRRKVDKVLALPKRRHLPRDPFSGSGSGGGNGFAYRTQPFLDIIRKPRNIIIDRVHSRSPRCYCAKETNNQ
jgi:hypothetical protein